MITANIAREMAFEKVNTTYDECFNEFMNSITEDIEENAKKENLIYTCHSISSLKNILKILNPIT